MVVGYEDSWSIAGIDWFFFWFVNTLPTLSTLKMHGFTSHRQTYVLLSLYSLYTWTTYMSSISGSWDPTHHVTIKLKWVGSQYVHHTLLMIFSLLTLRGQICHFWFLPCRHNNVILDDRDLQITRDPSNHTIEQLWKCHTTWMSLKWHKHMRFLFLFKKTLIIICGEQQHHGWSVLMSHGWFIDTHTTSNQSLNDNARICLIWTTLNTMIDVTTIPSRSIIHVLVCIQLWCRLQRGFNQSHGDKWYFWAEYLFYTLYDPYVKYIYIQIKVM